MALDFIRANTEYGSFANLLNGAWVLTAGSVSVWINPDLDGIASGPTWNVTTIWHHGNVYFGMTQDNNNKIRMYYYDGVTPYAVKTSTAALTKGSWNHVVYVWGNTNSKLYIDGSQDWSDNAFTFENLNAGYQGDVNSRIARNINAGFPMYYDGKILDLRIYDRKLDVAEVESIFSLEGSDGIDGSSLVMRLPMDEKPAGTGATAIQDVCTVPRAVTATNTPTFVEAPLKTIRM